MSISKIAGLIAESPTLALNQQARLLKEQGESVIHLGAGEPKSKAPIEAINSCIEQLSTGEIRYTPTAGIPSLIKAITDYTADNYNKTINKNNVIVSCGAKHSIAVLLYTIIDPKDEVIILTPYWVSYPEMVKMVNGVPVIVTPDDNKFEPTIEQLSGNITSRTKAIILNSPNNPSGHIYSADFIGELVKLCESKGIYLIMDDIYHKLIFDGEEVPNPYNYTNKDIDDSKIIIINGVSKLYAMTGFRIGWAVAPRNIVETMVNVQAQTTSCPPLPSQTAAVGALNAPQDGVEALRKTLQENCSVMVRELETIDGISLIKPKGTFYCLPDFSKYSNDSLELSAFLLDKVKVVTVPGKEFGIEGHLRLSVCGSAEGIIEAVKRIKWALEPNSPKEIQIGDKKVIRDW